MEKTLGQRIKECRINMGMTQEELAEAMLTKKSTISANENDKIDIKVSILKEIAALLGTTVAYLADGEKSDIDAEVWQVAFTMQNMESKELRKAAIEQMKILASLNGVLKEL